jgi:hypothetical protein
VRENTWYDAGFSLGARRSAGYFSQVFHYPINAGYDINLTGAIQTITITTPGTGYTNGVYPFQELTGGSGISAYATITVAGGVVTVVTVTDGGTQYVVGNTLSTAASSVGGTGANFSVPVAAVSNSAGTSWLGDNFDSVLLYGSLVEAYTYMKGEQDMMALYNGKYQEALALAKRLGDGMERQDAYRSGQYRQAVT